MAVSLRLFSRGVVRRPSDSVRWRKAPLIAITLLEEMSPSLSDEPLIEAIYDQIGGGPHAKRTFPRRYGKIDAAMLEWVLADMPERQISIHDMAASNAITSVELFEFLRGQHDISLHASDYYDAVRVVTTTGWGDWKVAFDVHDEPVQFIGKNWVVAPNARKYPVNRALANLLARFVLPEARSRLANGQARKLPLFHPNAMALSRTSEAFTIGRDDLFMPAPGNYDIVRIMSAFAGFADEDVKNGLARIGPTLREGGYLVIGRNRGRHTEEIPTSFFIRRNDRFVFDKGIDGGSELNPLVSAVRFSM